MYLQQVNFHKVIIYIDSRNIFSLSRNIKSCTWRVLCWRAQPGFEPGTSRTRSANHTPRPLSQAEETAAFLSRNCPCILNFGKVCFLFLFTYIFTSNWSQSLWHVRLVQSFRFWQFWQKIFWSRPGSNWGPSACKADVITTTPQDQDSQGGTQNNCQLFSRYFFAWWQN